MPVRFLICKYLLPVPCNFVLWYCGEEIRIEYSLEKGGAARTVTEGKKERLYIFLDSDEDKFPEPFQERYMRSLEDRVRTLEDEVYRQQAIILSMSQSMQALTGASEPRESPRRSRRSRRGLSPTPLREGRRRPLSVRGEACGVG
jgi:hypothetical protein